MCQTWAISNSETDEEGAEHARPERARGQGQTKSLDDEEGSETE